MAPQSPSFTVINISSLLHRVGGRIGTGKTGSKGSFADKHEAAPVHAQQEMVEASRGKVSPTGQGAPSTKQ